MPVPGSGRPPSRIAVRARLEEAVRRRRAARIPELRPAAGAAELLRKLAPARHRGTLHRAAATLRTTGAERARAMIEIFNPEERTALLGVTARTARGPSTDNLQGLDAA